MYISGTLNWAWTKLRSILLNFGFVTLFSSLFFIGICFSLTYYYKVNVDCTMWWLYGGDYITYTWTKNMFLLFAKTLETFLLNILGKRKKDNIHLIVHSLSPLKRLTGCYQQTAGEYKLLEITWPEDISWDKKSYEPSPLALCATTGRHCEPCNPYNTGQHFYG